MWARLADGRCGRGLPSSLGEIGKRSRKGFSMSLGHRWRFLKGYLSNPHRVGAFAPSSQALAAALCEPYRRCEQPARVLEVGAGTGAITRHLGALLSDHDELHVCEIGSEFADILEREVLTRNDFAPAVGAGRVKLFRSAIQDLPQDGSYDFIISGLPLNAFELEDVRKIFSIFRRSLKPEGVFSYFEYMGLRRTARWLSIGHRRQRIRSVSTYLTSNIRNHQYDRRIVLSNFPPARARYLRFDD